MPPINWTSKGIISQTHFLAADEALVLALGQAAAGVLHHGEGLGQKIVERFALAEALLELGRLGDELLVHQALVLDLELR